MVFCEIHITANDHPPFGCLFYLFCDKGLRGDLFPKNIKIIVPKNLNLNLLTTKSVQFHSERCRNSRFGFSDLELKTRTCVLGTASVAAKF